MRVLIVRIQIVNALGIKEDYILVVFFCVAAEKHLWDFSALKQENLPIPQTKWFPHIHWLDSPEHPYYFNLLLSKHLSEDLHKRLLPVPGLFNSKAVNLAMQGASIFSHVTHHCPKAKAGNHKFAIYLYQNQVEKYCWQCLEYFCIKSNSHLCFVYPALTQLIFRPGTCKT